MSQKATYILGISAYFHDGAAALLRDGEIVAAAQEERFSRKKADSRFPKSALEYCLAEANIVIGDVGHVVFYENTLRKFERLLESYLAFAPRGFGGFDFFKRSFRHWTSSKLQTKNNILKELGPLFCGEFHFAEHHASHAASAFFPSPFEEAAILTLDAVGEWTTSSVGYGKGNKITLLKEARFPHSLGMLYSAFTYYCGFKVNSGEYKLMGLAPYGSPRYADIIKKHLVQIHDDGSIFMDMSYFNYIAGGAMTSPKFHKLFGGEPRRPETFLSQKEMDLAASIQKVTEEIVLKAATFAKRETGSENLVMAGGVALNCVVNGRLLREGYFKRIWVQPASGDAGGALGAALLLFHEGLGNPRRPQKTDSEKGALLGPVFLAEDIETVLQSRGLIYERWDDESKLLSETARMLGEEKVVGWFQGRMEYGPRALGSRSILGDPRSEKMQKIMNQKIKFRESFRPFAPSILREHAHEIFEVNPVRSSRGALDLEFAAGLTHSSERQNAEHSASNGVKEDWEDPYMLFTAPVLDKWRLKLSEEDKLKIRDQDLRARLSVPRSKFPAVTHMDYSARVQTVDEERRGRYYRLIKKFNDFTGCPLLVNTSFNIRGEPIVADPEDAVLCFLSTDMDSLVLENFIVRKELQDKNLLAYAELRRERYKTMHGLD